MLTPLAKVAHLLFFNSAILYIHILATADKHLIKSYRNLTSCNQIVEAWLVYIGVLQTLYVGFPSSVLYLAENMAHHHHVHYRWHVFVIMFFISCQEAPMCISSVDSFLVWSGGSLILIFPVLLGVLSQLYVGKTSYILCVGIGASWAGVWRGGSFVGMSVCLYICVHLSVQPGVHQVAVLSTALNMGSLILLSQLCSSYSVSIMGHIALEAQQRVT